MNFEPFSAPVINALLYESPSAGSQKLSRSRLEEIREAIFLAEIPWISNRSTFEYVAKSPTLNSIYKCWQAMERERDPDDSRNHLTDISYFEYQIWFAVLETDEIYDLCKVFGFGECPNRGIPNRKIGAKVIAPILHEIKFGKNATKHEKIEAVTT